MSSKLETTTRCVAGLLERQAVLEEAPADQGDRTDTVGVMLRVTPHPGVLVVTNDPVAREEIVAILDDGERKIQAPGGSVQILATMRTLQAAIIVTDDHEIARSLRGLSPESYILLLTGDSDGEFAAGLAAGADDCIPRSGSRDAIRGRLRVARRTAHVESSLRSVMHEHRKLSTTDELTKVANRHFFARHFPLEVERAIRYQRSLSLLMCDIDHFKRVNDTYGHNIGDGVLREFGSRVQSGLRRGTDWVARIGGEEFAVVLPETDFHSAISAASKICSTVRALPFMIEGRKINVTASFGVAAFSAACEQEEDVASRLQSNADAALYRSKRAGRDRVMGIEEPSFDPRSRKR